MLLAGSKLNRKQEKEADSLGFILYNNTKYPPKEFINTLSVLIKYDTLPNILLKKSIYKKVFDIPKHPFKESWLKIENFEVYNYKVFKEKINKDSLKSHPELASRIKLLKKKFTKELSVYKELQPNIVFKKLKEIANNEDISNLSYLEKYGLSIYLTLSKLEKDPENKYFKKWIGKNFVKLYDAKKKYQFNRYVNRLKPKEQDESYQQFLSFLWNLNLKDIKVISDYYQ
ncbi:M48 family metalloprotease [Tenacibaculum ovolyticum]|uniref:M48 family metalloprotease n=1 Tax=Tenacibaculum ovolyticum TaxID=104270 RepID=UPI0022F3A6A2|nr:M48 family metalloprotease [Tenacibaculum ovolyticum]WBX78491.1 M48 family metalloprotease [Tenacibaculum ovolyticum]